MSGLVRLLGIGSLDDNFIEGLLDDLDDLGIQYPDMSDVDLTDTNEIIYSLMYEISGAFLSDFSQYVIANDIDFDLEWFEHEISLYSYGNNYCSWYGGTKLVWRNYFDLYIFLNSETAFKQLIKDCTGIKV